MRRARATSAATTSAADPASLGERFAAALAELGFTPERSAIAVSGGGDSVGLMMLFADWAQARKSPKPFVLIVDHGLRKSSAKDAALVKGWAQAEGFFAAVLPWRGKKPGSSIEEKARAARYALMGAWCKKQSVASLFLAHTQDDQAETFLLRLGRGSGVDGLSAMRPSAPWPIEGFEGMAVLRPLLGFGRAELRAFLERRKAPWIEDPMNSDPRFARTRVRELIPALEAAGVPAFRIAGAAGHLARARDALEDKTQHFLSAHAQFEPDGRVLVDLAALVRQPREIGLRALSAVLMQVSDRTYRPRFERLERLLDAIASEDFAKARTLHSCRIGRAPKAGGLFGLSTLVVTREGARRSSRKAEQDQEGPVDSGHVVRRKSTDVASNLGTGD